MGYHKVTKALKWKMFDVGLQAFYEVLAYNA